MTDTSHQPDGRDFHDFRFTPENETEAERIIGRYPKGREASAIMPLLWLAQYQMGAQTGSAWLPQAVIEYVADRVGVAHIRAHEVVSFYTMYNMKPIGRYHVQVCGTTPCMLRGSDDIKRACTEMGLVEGEITNDGLFTLSEVECIGCCTNGPVVQINDDNFEDLTYGGMKAILEDLIAGRTPEPGSEIGRQTSCPEGGPTTLKYMVDAHMTNGEGSNAG